MNSEKHLSADYLRVKDSRPGSYLKILQVEDNPGDIVLVSELLKVSEIQFDISTASTLKEAKLKCHECEFDAILLDLGLPDSIGLETLTKFQSENVIPPIIVMTGLDDEDTALESLRNGAQDYLVKNRLSSENILRAIKYGIERKTLQDLQKRHTHQFSVLSSATTSLNECEDITSHYNIICESISRLIDRAKLISIEFQDSKTFRISNIQWLEPWFDKIRLSGGLNLTDPVIQIPGNDSEFLKIFHDEKLHLLSENLHNILGGNIEKEVRNIIESELGINQIYAIGFVKNRNFYGGAFILTREIIPDDDIKVIETICNQASLSIYKRSIERMLQSTNELLRKENKIRKKQEENLRATEEKYRTVADFTYNWETWMGPDGKYIYISPSCQRITGYSVEEFMKDQELLLKITHPEDIEVVKNHRDKTLEGSITHSSFEFRIINKNGEERWIGHNCLSVFNTECKWMGQRDSNRDITKRKIAESVLIDSQKQLRALTHRMDAITEEERIRIAREIHDELGHLLTALKYDIESLTNKPELSPEIVKSELESIISMVDALIDSVRSIASELRPGILDHLGLIPSIEWQIRQFQMRTKISCEYVPGKINITFSKNETTIIFRILQEILTNVARHSGASKVQVSVSMENNQFVLTVIDNGKGFEMNDKYYTASLGLMGMRERALSIGSEFHIESARGMGTKIRLLLMKN